MLYLNYLNWPNIHAIYKTILFLTDIYVYKSYLGPLYAIYVIKSLEFC